MTDLRTVLEFIDEGYSGATLVRPALERLRDVAAAGGMDRLYVHCASSVRAQLCLPSAPGRGTEPGMGSR